MLTGTRLGVYEILEAIGAGGMGEVFRARDTRLQRDVALKLLPSLVASDPDRLARFTREAQVLAALNHPNIGAIHGLEESGPLSALVLELVEGPTLADRIAQGPVPRDEALGIARQIAEALEYAHEHGIIHRDLKPANIKLRPDGVVKVLDFGLAKALTSSHDLSHLAQNMAQSPTFTSPATMPGVILGTPAYLAPEQARGGTVDRRVDIWAFGAVLFEMLTATRPVGAHTNSVGDAMAAILRDEPAWSALPASTPPKLRQLLHRTLEKDPKRRLRDIGDARLELEDLQSGPIAETTPMVVKPTSRLMRTIPWTIAVLAVIAAALLGLRGRAPADEPPPLKYAIPIPNLTLERTGLPVLSPDGMRVVYARDGQLWIRELDRLEGRALSGTTGAQFPFWSPDSKQIGYLTANALWRAPIDGGAPIRIASCHFSKGGRTPGGVWTRDGTIVFAPAAAGTTFQAVSADGGEFHELVARDPKEEGDFHKPSLLPDGVSLLYIVDHPDRGADTIAVMSGGKKKVILRLSGEALDSPVYSPTGHLLYQRETTTPGIWAVPFSLEKLETTGPPFLVDPSGAWPSVGANGMVLYAESEITGVEDLAWLDIASGAVTTALNEQFPEVRYPTLSPDGTRIAAVTRSPENGRVVIVADLQRHTHVSIAERASASGRPVWRSDRSIIYGVETAQIETLMMRRADASEPAVELFRGMHPWVSRSGTLVFTRINAGLGGGLWHALLPSGDTAPSDAQVLQQTPVHEWEPTLSPSGKFLAYSQGDVGQSQVVLRGYPETSGQWQVSVSGGSKPLWSPTGDKLYFRDVPGQILVVDVATTPKVSLSAPRVIQRPSILIARAGFDISADGKRLLIPRIVKTNDDRTPSLTVIQNWLAEFKKTRRAE